MDGQLMEKRAGMGGAYEGASRLGRELASFRPKIVSADGALSQRDKMIVDARGHDLLRNVGPIQGASYIYRDSVVGSQYRLNAHPNIRVLGLDDGWLDEFQQEVEAKFMLWAESDENWVDAARMNNFTAMTRLVVAIAFAGGEALATSEWARDGRPFATCMQMVDCDRLSNPDDKMDTPTLRRGIERTRMGAPIAAYIRQAHPSDYDQGEKVFSWRRVPFHKSWGRLQVLHIMEQSRADMTRGVADMVSVLKETHMARKFHDVSLQNAIVQASYAAAIESELPSGMAFTSIGAEEKSTADVIAEVQMSMLEGIAEFSRGGRNLEIDGVKIPHLIPGSKLKLLPAGTVGGVGQSFEESLHRWISRGLNVSYEEYTNDYSKTNYSSSKAAANTTRRRMGAYKRAVADRFANAVYALWMEEAIDKGYIESVKHLTAKNPNFFYEGMNKQALCKASWIGAGIGQVDELKETQAAAMRIAMHTSTLEIECARFGHDYRDILAQQAREIRQAKALGIDYDPSQTQATKQGTMNTQRGAAKDDEEDEPINDGLDD
jgi:lambda family phage portal protein